MNNIRWYQVSMLLLFALVSGQGFAQQEPNPVDSLDTIKIEKLVVPTNQCRLIFINELPE